jgi:hypothetical protein
MFFRIKQHGVAFEAAAAMFGERAFTSEAVPKAKFTYNWYFRTISKLWFIVPQVANLCFSELSGAVLPSKLLLRLESQLCFWGSMPSLSCRAYMPEPIIAQVLLLLLYTIEVLKSHTNCSQA